MRRQNHQPQTRSNLHYIAFVILGGITGVLLSRFVFPVVFERGDLVVFLAFAILLVGAVLIARLLWWGGSRP
jgi:hypothetical protein